MKLTWIHLGMVLLLAVFAGPTRAQAEPPFFDRYAISAGYGTGFHPSDTRVNMVFANPSLTHDFGHSWRGYLEAFLGSTLTPENRLAIGLTPLAHYSLTAISLPDFFVEGGVGLFYTGVKVRGFGSNWVFSPQAGAGYRIRITETKSLTLRLRYHHLSNAYLSKDNTSIDSLLLMIGLEFGK